MDVGQDRWLAAADGPREVACVGDSITIGVVDPESGEPGLSWVDLLAGALGSTSGRVVDGFRGLWLRREWKLDGSWTQTTRADRFDAAPFGFGFVGSGDPSSIATWTNPSKVPVDRFDLFLLAPPAAGGVLIRVDDGPWRAIDGTGGEDATGRPVTRCSVDQVVHHRVQIRAAGDPADAVVGLAGIDVHAADASADPSTRVRVHHLGLGMHMLGSFTRATEGAPLAVLDELAPDVVLVAFSNDVLWAAPSIYEDTLRGFVDHVTAFADVVVISPFEQRPPRRVHDVDFIAGSCRVSSATARFSAIDLTAVVQGSSLPADRLTTIAAVSGPDGAELSAPAIADESSGELVIGEGREVEVQAAYRDVNRRVAAETGCRYLDVYDAWLGLQVTGWDAAVARGLMIDTYHATLDGHRDIAERLVELLGKPSPEPAGVSSEPRSDPGANVGGAAAVPELVPGTGRVAASATGPVQLEVPISLSPASEQTVTVDWQTRVADSAALPQAAVRDYVPARGTVTFGPGQTEAVVSITVLGHSSEADVCIVVAFSRPHGAVVTGDWGLGFGIVEPPAAEA